ncbi:hypothetical protein [Flavivirga jejuensis]|uniref:SMODS and SLOG-associating 2TM effector domain-containing protein n=1 Tax=Flavivirga jejuensis TaxID=870487 RepID=A0ABT8WLH1_9FLAO|nr:hypothetical protein [Flavivirga jejuensis]MDO5974002.1 hypothetical protein [Flavivirga jejuensis]
MEKWEANLNNWKHLSTDSIQLMLKQSEECLDETVKTFENVSTKTNQMLTIAISILTVTIGYFVDFDKNNIELKIIALFVVVICSTIIIVLYKNLFFDKIGVKGSPPKHIIKDKFFNEGIEPKNQYANIVLNECEKYQERIDKNNIVNDQRRKRITIAIKLFFLLPLSIIIGRLIMLLI